MYEVIFTEINEIMKSDPLRIIAPNKTKWLNGWKYKLRTFVINKLNLMIGQY